MTIEMITLVIVVSLLVLIAAGLPIVFCLMAISVAGFIVWVKPAALTALASIAYTATTLDYFIALPAFIFMAAVLQVSGLGTVMYDMMYKWMAGLRGGLAMGTILISTVIAAMSGAAATSTVVMGLLAYPEMNTRGYSKEMAIGCIPAGGCLGPLIPPSIPMILIAGLSSVSIGKLFMTGVFPGLLTSLLFVLYIGLRSFFNPTIGPPIPLAERANWREKLICLRGGGGPILLICLVLGLIYTGIATPTEAGGVGAFGALICAAIYRNLNWKNMKSAIILSLKLNAMIYWLLIAGMCFSSMLTITGVTGFVTDLLVGLVAERWIVLFMMLGIVWIMGMFIDPTAIIIITLPVFIPIVRSLGFNVLWFDLIFIMDLLIGYITPPFGANLFYFKGLNHPGVTMADIYLACLPFVGLMTIAWAACIASPQIAIWLPGTMIK